MVVLEISYRWFLVPDILPGGEGLFVLRPAKKGMFFRARDWRFILKVREHRKNLEPQCPTIVRRCKRSVLRALRGWSVYKGGYVLMPGDQIPARLARLGV